jgi:hypothetical protein
MVFGFFRKKESQKTVMDGFIKMAYGSQQKTAILEDAIELSSETLLGSVVNVAEVRGIATQLYNGPLPYSTHDLAVATALNVFRSANTARREELGHIQIFSRMALLEWVKEQKVMPLLAKAFEDTLYKMFKA